jgi:hypothetical protein
LLTVGLPRDFQTVGYVHVGNEVFIRAGAINRRSIVVVKSRNEKRKELMGQVPFAHT